MKQEQHNDNRYDYFTFKLYHCVFPENSYAKPNNNYNKYKKMNGDNEVRKALKYSVVSSVFTIPKSWMKQSTDKNIFALSPTVLTPSKKLSTIFFYLNKYLFNSYKCTSRIFYLEILNDIIKINK